MKQNTLWIDPAMGMAGDMFSSALIGLGVPERGLTAAMQAAGETVGLVDVHAHLEFLPEGTPAHRLHVIVLEDRAPLPIEDAAGYLEQALAQAQVSGPYADFARRALTILIDAERTVHGSTGPDAIPDTQQVSLTVIGRAHTPYHHEAPYQPATMDDISDGAFYIDLDPQYTRGLPGLETFTHLFVISYLDRSLGYDLMVKPPWQTHAERYGLFATRSPSRPSPIGLTRTRLQRIEGNRVYTGPLDLFDGTPILDVKPFIRSLDGAQTVPPADDEMADGASDDGGNDGWLEGSEHLELHRRGIPHTHPGGGHLHEAQDLLLDVVGAAWGLQWLKVDLEAVTCLSPVRVGGGVTSTTSHGRMSIPAPATKALLSKHQIPYASGPVDAELLTPTGAAILAALAPTFVARGSEPQGELRVGVGLGHRTLDRPNALRLMQVPGT